METERSVNPKPFQFSLRAMTVAMTAYALLLGLIAWSWNSMCSSRARTARQIADLERGKRAELCDPDPGLLEAIAKNDACAERVTEVAIVSPANMSDAAYRHLKRYPHLRIIRLENVSNVDGFLQGIQGMASLEVLHLHHVRLSSTGARYLGSFPRLKTLYLDHVNDAVMEEIKAVTQLQTLEVAYSQVTDNGLSHLEGLIQLRRLRLWHTEVSDSGVRQLKQAIPACVVERVSPAPAERQSRTAPDHRRARADHRR